MGCSDSIQSTKPKNLSPYKLNKGPMPLDIQLKILRNTLEVKKMKLEGNLQRNILELERTIKQPLRSRNKVAELLKIQDSTLIKNQAHIYGVIVDYLKVLEQYKQLLKDPNHIRELKPLIMNILYAKEAIRSDQLQQFCGQILKKYPFLKDPMTEQEKLKTIVTDEIIEYHRNQRIPNNKMVSQFAMELCKQQEGIDPNLVNASGNKFCYQ